MESPDQDYMERYEEYLKKNYKGGTDRFFSPTGFLGAFQRTVEVKAQATRSHVLVRNMEEAEGCLQPVVTGGEGVFDLTAEPGTGKTSVLPFRFPTKKVIVALPAPFDAWSAFNMATGKCQLKIKGLTLGSPANVVYTDSYMAAKAVLSNYMDYDIMMVDECDSDKGVTRFLSEVKAPGKLLIRMSASHGASSSGVTTSYQVVEAEDMPDVRESETGFADYIKSKPTSRSLVLAPDAAVASRLHKMIKGSVLVTPDSPLAEVARHVLDQRSKTVYVSDSACGRGLSLNLDVVFDSQLITEYGLTRNLTDKELYQRKGRLGRNKPGYYYSPGLGTEDKRDSDIDVVRNNVVRGIAEVDQQGSDRLRVTGQQALSLMCSGEEPYMELEVIRREESSKTAVISDSESARSSSDSSYRISSATSVGSSRGRTVEPPKWLYYFSGSAPGASAGVVERSAGSLRLIKAADRSGQDSDGSSGRRRRKRSSQGSSGSDGLARKFSGLDVTVESRSYMESERRPSDASRSRKSSVSDRRVAEVPKGSHRLSRTKSGDSSMPYSADRSVVARPALDVRAIPVSPPVMDLTETEYDIDWPALIRDRLLSGGDLPTLVPPGSWRHTSSTGLGTDWMRRLEDMAGRDQKFDDSEFEVVCRAWNLLVAQSWVRRTPGLSTSSSADKMEFCARYFQSYFLLGSAQ